jgi:hypothetical protein
VAVEGSVTVKFAAPELVGKVWSGVVLVPEVSTNVPAAAIGLTEADRVTVVPVC